MARDTYRMTRFRFAFGHFQCAQTDNIDIWRTAYKEYHEAWFALTPKEREYFADKLNFYYYGSRAGKCGMRARP